MNTPHERLTRTTFSLPLGEVHALVGGAVNARPLSCSYSADGKLDQSAARRLRLWHNPRCLRYGGAGSPTEPGLKRAAARKLQSSQRSLHPSSSRRPNAGHVIGFILTLAEG